MKKISIILSIIMLTGIISVNTVSYAAADTVSLKKAETLLGDINIAEKQADYSADVTRGEFSYYLSKLLNISLTPKENTLPYEDVVSDSPYYKGIYIAHELGIISDAYKFEPDRKITYNEAVKMAVTALGYDYMAEYYGGYPIGYATVAANFDLLKGVSGNETNLGFAYVLMYNMLKTKLPAIEIKTDNVTYKAEEGQTLIRSVHHLSIITGRFDGAQFFGGESGKGMGKGKTGISGYSLYMGGFDTDNYFAQKADVYYNDEYVITSVYVYQPTDDSVLTINSSQNISFGNNNYKYDGENDKVLSAAISSDSLLVFNGKYTSFDADIMVPEHGSVKLIRSSLSGKYDTVIIKSYDEIVVGSIISNEMLVSDVYDNTKTYSFAANDYTALNIYDQNDKASDFSGISTNDVLWIALSADKKLMDVIICKDMFAGKLTGIGTENYIHVDECEYYATDRAKSCIDETINIGSIIVCYVNIEGEVVYIAAQPSNDSYNIGYLIMTGRLKSGISSKIEAKILTGDGKIKIYEFADSFNINGIHFKGSVDSVYDKLPKDINLPDSMTTGIISYVLNRSKQITMVNYADSAADAGSYTNIFENGRIEPVYGDGYDLYIRYYQSDMAIFSKGEGRIFITSDTMQFIVPEPADAATAKEKDYKVRKIYGITSGTYMTKQNHTGYTLKKGSLRSDYILSTYSISSASDVVSETEPLSIVKNVSTVLSDEGYLVDKLELQNKFDKSISVYSEERGFFKNNNIEKGDLVKVEYNTNNIVTGIILIYKMGESTFRNTSNYPETGYTANPENTVLNSNAGMGTLSSSHIVLGRVFEKDEKVITILPYNINPAGYTVGTTLFKYSMTNASAMKYDTKTGIVSTLDFVDIKDYNSIGNSCDTIVAEGYSGGINAIYLYD